MPGTQEAWQKHYLRKKSSLDFPDENIVRYVRRAIRSGTLKENTRVLDLGCGSLRHLYFLQKENLSAIGQDFSYHALRGSDNTVCATADSIPFCDKAFELVIAWGVFHYMEPAPLRQALVETKRILTKGGKIFCTLRSDLDTHLAKTAETGDLAGSHVSYFSLRECEELFSEFNTIKTGFISRQSPGEAGLIAHHVIEAEV